MAAVTPPPPSPPTARARRVETDAVSMKRPDEKRVHWVMALLGKGRFIDFLA